MQENLSSPLDMGPTLVKENVKQTTTNKSITLCLMSEELNEKESEKEKIRKRKSKEMTKERGQRKVFLEGQKRIVA